jgi:hypothetical protein
MDNLQTRIDFLITDNNWKISYSEIFIFDNGLLSISIDLMPDYIDLIKARTDLLRGDINLLRQCSC